MKLRKAPQQMKASPAKAITPPTRFGSPGAGVKMAKRANRGAKFVGIRNQLKVGGQPPLTDPAAPAVGANPAASLANDGTTMRMPAMQPPTPTQPGTPLQQEQPRTIGPAQQEQQMKDQLMPLAGQPPGAPPAGQPSQAGQPPQEAPQSALPAGQPPQAGQQPQNAAPMGQPPQGAGAPQAPAQDNSALDQQIAALQKQIADLQGQKK